MGMKVPKYDYVGMDAKTLEEKRVMLNSYRDYYKSEIKNAESVIEEQRVKIAFNERSLRELDSEYRKLNNAMKQAGNVIYEKVIQIKRCEFYDTMQEAAGFKYYIANANVLGLTKGCIIIKESGKFRYKDKDAFVAELITKMKQEGITKLYLASDVKINTAFIKKSVPNCVIVRE